MSSVRLIVQIPSLKPSCAGLFDGMHCISEAINIPGSISHLSMGYGVHFLETAHLLCISPRAERVTSIGGGGGGGGGGTIKSSCAPKLITNFNPYTPHSTICNPMPPSPPPPPLIPILTPTNFNPSAPSHLL